MARTIVILHPGGLGDVLLAVPAIRALRERFSSNQFLLCAQSQAAELLHDCGIVDRWISVESTACAALFGGTSPVDRVLRDWLSRCDLAVAWTHDDAGVLAATLKGCGATAVVVGSPFTLTLSSVHQSDRFSEIIVGQVGQVVMTTLSVPKALRTQAESYLATCGFAGGRPLALVHPGSGSRHKCAAPEVLLPVLEGLEADGLELLLLEGPADQDLVARLVSRMARRPVLVRGLSVRLLAGVLSKVDLFLGHDSGVTHLAALLGTPTVGLFGPTDPARWSPRGPFVRVVQEQPCQCHSWEAVRNCDLKPCLEFSAQAILAASRSVRTVSVNPRIS